MVLEAESWGWSAEPSASYLPLGEEPRLQLVGVVGLNVEFLELDSSRKLTIGIKTTNTDNKQPEALDDDRYHQAASGQATKHLRATSCFHLFHNLDNTTRSRRDHAKLKSKQSRWCASSFATWWSTFSTPNRLRNNAPLSQTSCKSTRQHQMPSTPAR